MRIILDTGVFFHPEALGMMRWFAAPVIVPAVVFAERARHLSKAGVHPNELVQLLDSFGAVVEPLSDVEATRFSTTLHHDATWQRLARDAFIAGHVQPSDRLFTTNVSDFVELGLPRDQIVEIPVWRARERVKHSPEK